MPELTARFLYADQVMVNVGGAPHPSAEPGESRVVFQVEMSVEDWESLGSPLQLTLATKNPSRQGEL